MQGVYYWSLKTKGANGDQIVSLVDQIEVRLQDAGMLLGKTLVARNLTLSQDVPFIIVREFAPSCIHPDTGDGAGELHPNDGVHQLIAAWVVNQAATTVLGDSATFTLVQDGAESAVNFNSFQSIAIAAKNFGSDAYEVRKKAELVGLEVPLLRFTHEPDQADFFF